MGTYDASIKRALLPQQDDRGAMAAFANGCWGRRDGLDGFTITSLA
jgi:hypothetical protein